MLSNINPGPDLIKLFWIGVTLLQKIKTNQMGVKWSHDFSKPIRGLEFWRRVNLRQNFLYKIGSWSQQCYKKHEAPRSIGDRPWVHIQIEVCLIVSVLPWQRFVPKWPQTLNLLLFLQSARSCEAGKVS